ncbi:KGG domain-containing protein [Ramlibacter humi]|uniref:Stress-induced protein n=1 Tax=Ramlibacter humi TaxID=2530451 RepID=A0A4Z0BHT4_9BURK|nr:KGG domain-containing protein [Ramlibacter humi]TFY97684.1 stress-induced protein [Ramlibacter humi]
MATQDTSPQRQDGTAGAGSKRSLRGFAAMDPQRQREIASLGGRAAHQSGHAHEFTTEEARAAGKKRHAMRSANGAAR